MPEWGANRMRVAELEFAFRFSRDLPPRQQRHYDRPPESSEKKVPERFRVE